MLLTRVRPLVDRDQRDRCGHRGCCSNAAADPGVCGKIARMRRTVALLASGLMASACVALPPAERVRFPAMAAPGEAPVAIEALLLRPDGAASEGGRPAVIALHGCGGLFSTAKGREDELTERHRARAEAMLAAGYVVLFPDSLGPRGIRELCTTKTGERRLTAAGRRGDALGALQWLAAQPGIARDRIALLGWSHGGTTTLAAVGADDALVRSLRDRAGAPPFFRAAVAFYPGCSVAARNERWRPAAPLRILIGGADDWTPAAPCEALATRGRERGWPLETIVYPGAWHGFDAPSGRVRLRTDVPNGVAPGQGVHVGPDPAARADANRRVEAFLRDALGR
jgi:dienelactone hydrolase